MVRAMCRFAGQTRPIAALRFAPGPPLAQKTRSQLQRHPEESPSHRQAAGNTRSGERRGEQPGIEAGVECARWQPVLSAIADGEATAAQITDARPHLRNCPACRATLRGLQGSARPLAAVLPLGLVGAGAKLSGLVERLMPTMASSGGEASATAAGAGVLGLGGMKLAGLVAAGAAATAGGGLVVEHEVHRPSAARPATTAERAWQSPPSTSAAIPAPRAPATQRQQSATPSAADPAATRRRARRRVVARRRQDTGRIEFAPGGGEAAGASAPAVAAVARRPADPAPSPPPPLPAASSRSADTARGEFAPQP